ncbi:unnamed protein product [Arabidopsis thaliana]|uniref:F-box domain-containing protein n=1 Tax=Arabidopsis thaliana TaxID=3702 RepID=A0A654F989_ARATH|nr:unnamed protein product [Arabidopsis thaliana]
MHLPEDLVLEILSKVPAVSLARFRSTCRRWNALVVDGSFAKKHYAYGPRQYPIVIMLIEFRVYLVSIDLHGINNNNGAPSAKLTGQFSLKDPLSNSSEEVDIRNAFHCDGLLLCCTKDRRLVVWNPCSGETKWIQPRNSYKESDLYALGYDNRSSSYKILRMHPVGNPFHIESEVYDFASHSWRSVGVTTDFHIQTNESYGMNVKGFTYWFALSKDWWSSDDRRFLLSFDFSRERFQCLPLPADVKNLHLTVVLSVTREEQQLCMFATLGAGNVYKLDVFVATKTEETTGELTWTKFRRFHSKICINVSADHEKKVLVPHHILLPYYNILHIVGEDIYIRQVNKDGDIRCPILLTYVPSLVQIQQGI